METQTPRLSGNGKRATAAPRSPVPVASTAKTRGRLPEAAVAVLLVAGCVIAFVVWSATGGARTRALVVAHDVTRGEVLTAADLRVASIGADDGVAHFGADESATVIGQAAATDLHAGTLLSADVVTDPAQVLAEGDGVAGLALEPGQYPSVGLAAGDRVNVVIGTQGSGTDKPSEEPLVAGAMVVRVGELSTVGKKFVSLRMSEPDANRLATAVASGSAVRLVQVGGG